MKKTLLAFVLAALAGCGADGEPIKPTVSGSVSIGTGGISTSAGVAARKGPVGVSLSL